MPFGQVKLIPGVNVERTQTLNEAGYSFATLGRFQDGLFQKLGGWTRFINDAVDGIPRAIHAWQDNEGVGHLAIGTTTGLFVITDGEVLDISPQRLITDGAVFSTTAGSTTVTVIDGSVGTVTTFDLVFFNTPIEVGGIILSGGYPIISVLGAGTYQITAAEPAVSTVAGGGDPPAFHSATGSNRVRVEIVDHDLVVGNTITFPIATVVGGITIIGTYEVISVVDADNFTIGGGEVATSSDNVNMNNGDAQLVYYISLGPEPAGGGFGLGPFGMGPFGIGSPHPAQTGTPFGADDWHLDNWGDLLVACPRGGGIYWWDPARTYSNAALVLTAPLFNNGLFVAMPQQILVAWASTIEDDVGIHQDPLRIKWSAVEDFFDWQPNTNDQAGGDIVPTGSEIRGAIQGPQRALIVTDLDCYALNYVQAPAVFGLQKIGANCGLIAPHAITQFNRAVYWMGESNFFVAGGQGVQPIPCTVWDVLFQDLETAQKQKCNAGTITSYNEVIFFYPSISGAGTEPDKYVKMQVAGPAGGGLLWDYGSLDRTTWIDQNVLGGPIATRSNGQIFNQEDGFNADGAAMIPVMITGYFMIEEGGSICFVDWILPDFRYGQFGAAQNAQIKITIFTVMNPGDAPLAHGPYTVVNPSEPVVTRARGRQMAIRIESDDLGSFWRLGRVRYRYAIDGQR